MLATVESIQAAAKFLIELRKLGSLGLIVFLQEPESFPDNLARRVVAAGFHLGADELLQFGCKGDIHAYTLASVAKIVNV
jgi:hypothetical protein